MSYQKIKLKGYEELDLYPVYSQDVYIGHEPFKVVGIRKHEVELEGNFSGGTHDLIQKAWFDYDNVFIVKKLCDEQIRAGGCQLPNVHCCGGGGIITKHEEYWKDLIK